MRTIAIAFSLVAGWCMAADWPAFRGPEGTGISTETTAPLHWSQTQNVKWKVALPRPGNGSPIVSQGLVLVTSAEDAKGSQRTLYAFDRKSGEKKWSQTVTYEKEDPTHDTNPYCGTTPAANGKQIVVWHSSAGLYCYDYAGKELWHQQLGDFHHIWGYGTSPVIYNDRVILHSGPGKQIFVAAYSLADGKELWKNFEPFQGDGDYRAPEGSFAKAYMGSWSTPVIATIQNKPQAIVALPTRVVSYDIADGQNLWWCEGLRSEKGDLSYSSPVIVGDLCVTTGGFGGPSFAFKLGGKGNITDSQRLWRKTGNPQNIGSGVAVDGHYYRPNAGANTIECIDPYTGNAKWTERAGSYWGSIVVAAGRCYAIDQRGETIVFKPSPEKFEMMAKNSLGDGCNSTPAISDGQIFIRTQAALWCVGE